MPGEAKASGWSVPLVLVVYWRAILDDLVGDTEEAAPDQARYGVLVALYRRHDTPSPT